MFFLGKCVCTAAKTMVVDRKSQKAPGLLYLLSGSLPNAANSSDVPTKFAGGDQLLVPYAVPMISTIRVDFSFVTCSYDSQLFSLQSVSALQQNTTKVKSSKANFVTQTFRLPPFFHISIYCVRRQENAT